MSLLCYTFSTFPDIQFIERHNMFVFHKLKSDLIAFLSLIEKVQPDIIVGIAKSPNSKSRFERMAINKFNRTKLINKSGEPSYKLSYPAEGYKNISLHKSYTDSFCNWVMYKLSEHLLEKSIPLQFIHVAPKDIDILDEYLKSLS